ncbi:NUDIX hydrolase [Bacillus solimangrovi]|uniref:NUDIX hydrolase n=1 Tax=Bacillus solimangrovi TaxID=1305675 RepID=A0A1E5LI73_9BACI|nr:NUDIX domain-containing protein [Bacillus solimangrovi]OEH93784.1 NUDIX hydrolase [Bacillus solimangrovi]
MDTEKLKIYDDNRNPIGVATRKEVHEKGYWHEAIHCWFVSKIEGVYYIFLQKRSANKKDYPNLLDITAAGHLLAHETIHDGVREIEEEIGISISFDELISLGVIDYSVMRADFIDKELANVFLYESELDLDDFTLQEDEVSGIVRIMFEDFCNLWLGKQDFVKVQGYEIDINGKRINVDDRINKEQFVPHELTYYKSIINKISDRIIHK